MRDQVVDRVSTSMVVVLVMVSRPGSRAFQGSIADMGISSPFLSSYWWPNVVIWAIKLGKRTSTRLVISVPDANIGTSPAYVLDAYGTIYGFGFAGSNPGAQL